MVFRNESGGGYCSFSFIYLRTGSVECHGVLLSVYILDVDGQCSMLGAGYRK